MKIIKEESIQEKPKVDQEKLAKLQEDFDRLNQQLQTKEYDILLNKTQTDFLLNSFYNEVDWKGYESYAISETHRVISPLVKKDEIKGKAKSEIIEAVFHFLKNYTSKGIKNASAHKSVCDQFAIPINEINKDRQTLRDVSLELVSVEQGIPVEEVVKRMNESKL